MQKSNAKKLIKESKSVLKDEMTSNLEDISAKFIAEIIKDPSLENKPKIKTEWFEEYKSNLQEAMAVVSREAIDQVKKEIPGGSKISFVEQVDSIRLSELDKLPAELIKKILSFSATLIGKQVADLENIIIFQLANSIQNKVSASELEGDLIEAAEEYFAAQSITAGAGLAASTIVNDARSAFFYQDDTLEKIDAFQFVNDSPVTDICSDLNGSIFEADDPGADLYRPPLHFNAVLENSLIEAPNGLIKIQDIKENDIVITHTGQNKKVLKTMSKFEDKEYFVLELDNGKSISLTGEHPVLTKNRSWVRCDELNLTDDIVCIEDVYYY